MTTSSGVFQPETGRAPARLSGALLVLLLSLCYIIGTAGVLALLLLQFRDEAIESGEQLNQSFAQLIEEQSTSSLRVADQLLHAALRMVVERDPDLAGEEPSINQALRDLVESLEFVESVGIVSEEALLIYAAVGDIGADLSNREHFLAARSNPMSGLRTGRPFARRPDGKWLIPVALPIARTDGSFAGMVAVVLDPLAFDRAWSYEHAGKESSIALLRADGTMLMRSPMAESAMGDSFAQAPVFRDYLPNNDSGTFQSQSLIDGVERMISYRRVEAFPDLVVVVTQALSEVLASWYRTVAVMLIGWLAASVGIAALTFFLMRELRRRSAFERGLASANDALRAEVRERARAENDAVQARARLMDAVRAFPGGFRLYDKDERLILSNDIAPGFDEVGVAPPRIGETFGAFLRRIAGVPLASVGREEAWVQERLAQFRRGDTDIETTLGGKRWFHVVERPTADGGRISLTLEVTERKVIEEQLQQAQKMEAVGQLTGGVAHDFNNMLTVIMGNAEILLEQIGEDDAARQAADTIMRAAEGSADLTSRLLAFARRTPLRPVRLDVLRFVVRIEGLLRRTLGEDVDIQMIPEPGLWEVMIDPSQLEQAILNLSVNARDAMPSGGKLTIDVENVTLDETYAAANQDARAGEFVAVSISDTGIGMSQETVQHAFEPFFTSKETGKGTGLGLSMVYGFVRQSGGHVKIYSEVRRGTTVRMYLPRATEDAEYAAERSGEDGTIPLARKEHVLVVEDDELVRQHVEAQLTSLGYRIASVSDGPSAIGVLSGSTRVDLLFTDVVMPGGLSGREVAEEAKRLRPSIKVLYTSGYTKNAIMHGGRLDADARLLSKPYRLRELAEKIREALDEA